MQLSLAKKKCKLSNNIIPVTLHWFLNNQNSYLWTVGQNVGNRNSHTTNGDIHFCGYLESHRSCIVNGGLQKWLYPLFLSLRGDFTGFLNNKWTVSSLLLACQSIPLTNRHCIIRNLGFSRVSILSHVPKLPRSFLSKSDWRTQP